MGFFRIWLGLPSPMRELGGIDASETYMKLCGINKHESARWSPKIRDLAAYSLVSEISSLRRYSFPWQPAPACYSAARGVIQSEVVRIANTSNSTEYALLSKVVRFDVIDARYAPEVCLVQANSSNRRDCCRDGRKHTPRVSQRRAPIGRLQRLDPQFGNALLLVIVGA
jgi:hypothetical protein